MASSELHMLLTSHSLLLILHSQLLTPRTAGAVSSTVATRSRPRATLPPPFFFTDKDTEEKRRLHNRQNRYGSIRSLFFPWSMRSPIDTPCGYRR